MGILRDFRRLADAMERLAATQAHGVNVMEESRPALDRLDELERSRSRFEVEIEAVLMKAEGKYQAANNAEARTRTMKKTYEEFVDLDPDREEEPTPVPAGDAPAEPTEGMHVLHVGMAREDKKAQALRFKFS